MDGSQPDMKAEASTEQFLMYGYKVIPCSKRYRHDWSVCPFAHNGEMAARRDPRLYQPMFCYHSKQRLPCPRGDACPYAHNLFEYWLHPARYRTEMCQFGVSCTRPVCFFAHGESQRRVTGIAGGPQPVVAPPEPLVLGDMPGPIGSNEPVLLANINKAAMEQQQQLLQLQHQHQHPVQQVHSDVLPVLHTPGLTPAPAASLRTAPLPGPWHVTPAPAQSCMPHLDLLALQQQLGPQQMASAPLPAPPGNAMHLVKAAGNPHSRDVLAQLQLLQCQQQAQQLDDLSRQLASLQMGVGSSGGAAAPPPLRTNSLSAPLPQVTAGSAAAADNSTAYLLKGLSQVGGPAAVRYSAEPSLPGSMAAQHGAPLSPMDAALLQARVRSGSNEPLLSLPEAKPWSAPASPSGSKQELTADLQSISFTSSDSQQPTGSSAGCTHIQNLSLQMMADTTAGCGSDGSTAQGSGPLSNLMSLGLGTGEQAATTPGSEGASGPLPALMMVGDVPLRAEQLKDQLASPLGLAAKLPAAAGAKGEAPLGVEAAAQLLGQLPEEHVRQLLMLVKGQHSQLPA